MCALSGAFCGLVTQFGRVAGVTKRNTPGYANSGVGEVTTAAMRRFKSDSAHTLLLLPSERRCMDAETLLSEWHDNNHRPQWIVDTRDQLMDYCDLSEPIPRRKSELGDYLRRYKSTITKQLQDAASDNSDGEQDGETTNTNGDGD